MPLIMGCDTAWHPAISNVTHKCTHTQTQTHTHSKVRVLGAAHAGTFYICIFIIIIISSSRLNSDMRSGCCMKCLSQEMKTISSSFFVFTPYASKGWCIKSKYMQHTRGNRLISALKRIWIVKGLDLYPTISSFTDTAWGLVTVEAIGVRRTHCDVQEARLRWCELRVNKI